MKLTSKDPIIRTLLSQIEEAEVDLEPDFQRGEVWGVDKQQMLIDTILRDWQMPPIFMVVNEESGTKEVLDGHQRLTSIVNFFNDAIRVNGNIEPWDDEVGSLHGLYYCQLPEQIKRKIQNYSIRVFEITDYKESEPFELFFRLNQSVKLTSAERRNTFFGEVRAQVKRLVMRMEELGYGTETIGFSNSRLSYHDVIARALYALESGSLAHKITDFEITDRYRSNRSYPDEIELRLEYSIELLMDAVGLTGKLKLSKPSLFSILCFFSEKGHLFDLDGAGDFLSLYRQKISSRTLVAQNMTFIEAWLLKEYSYRMSASVNDVKSVILRRFFLYDVALESGILNLTQARKVIDTKQRLENLLPNITNEDAYNIILKDGWGSFE